MYLDKNNELEKHNAWAKKKRKELKKDLRAKHIKEARELNLNIAEIKKNKHPDTTKIIKKISKDFKNKIKKEKQLETKLLEDYIRKREKIAKNFDRQAEFERKKKHHRGLQKDWIRE